MTGIIHLMCIQRLMPSFPPGDYLFRVRGSNNNGVWNQEEATLSVRILPPWWRTVWAYLIYIIVVSGSFVLNSSRLSPP